VVILTSPQFGDIVITYGSGGHRMPTPREQVGALKPYRTVEVGGVTLAYNDEGEGIPIVCLHATGHGARDFAGIRNMLKTPVRVIAIDWPGQGCSSDDHIPASAKRYSELLEGFVATLGLDHVIILGNSIGGAAAMEFAARKPDTVAALILANPGGLVAVDRVVNLFCRIMSAFFRAGVKRWWWFGPAFRIYYRTVLKKGSIAEHRARIVAAGYDHAPALAQAWHSFSVPGADIRSLASKIKCPVLFTWGKYDYVLSLSKCRPAIEMFQNGEVAVFNAGHCAFLEDEAAFQSTFNRFILSVVQNAQEIPTAYQH
jgi:pimeloyl-ACP methyl ester carboxylesterase